MKPTELQTISASSPNAPQKRLKNVCPECGANKLGNRTRLIKKVGHKTISVKPYLCYSCGAEFTNPSKVMRSVNLGKLPKFLKRAEAV